MEVEVLGVNGVPLDAIISIRAGASRRQAPVSTLYTDGKPFRFAGGVAGVNPFKVDILQPIGSTRLALKPGGGTFTVPLRGASGVTVDLCVRNAAAKGDGAVREDLFDRIDVNQDGVITRSEFNEALRTEVGTAENGDIIDKPVLQPLAGGQALTILSADDKNRLPPLPKAEDGRFPAAATAAKEYLESNRILPFVRGLLQTVVREQPADPYNFIADQFRNAAYVPTEEDLIKQGKARAAVEAASKARLASAMSQNLEETHEKQANIAVHDTLSSLASQLGVDLTKLSPQERQEANAEAKAAMAAVISRAAMSEEERAEEESKQKAKEDDVFAARLAKLEEVKEKARAALEEDALLNGKDDMEEIKATARDALSDALLGDNSDLEQAKSRAREALVFLASALGREATSLLGDGDDELEKAKSRTRDSLSSTLPGGEKDGALEDVELARKSSRDALAAALLRQSSVAEASAGDGDDELTIATRKKAQLELTKVEMGKMNHALKDEVSDLNNMVDALVKERDTLRLKMSDT